MTVAIPSTILEKFTTFGDLLRFLRRRTGLTQTELAIAVGYGHTQISRLEQNLRLPDIPTVKARFVSALGLEEEPKVVARLLDLAANIRREDAPALGLCPYKGLNYFDEADADLFVGREALTDKLVERVLSLVTNQQAGNERFLAVVGASGSGKSSLVRAGLVPALRWNPASTDWQIHILTPTAHPLESLTGSLTTENSSVARTAQVENFRGDASSLQTFVKQKLGSENGSHLLLIVDQFEELFALCRSEEERISFIGNLLSATAEPDGPVIVVITLRADFYAHCANYPELREALAKYQEYIGTMNIEEMRRAVEEPAQRGRWEFEPGLVDLLLHDVGREPGALPLLSHALLETWQRRRGRMMTMSGYASSGGVRGAIAETAETVFTDQFTREQQAIARRIFLRLTELSDETSMADTRRRATFNELILKPEEAATTHAVLKALADARLITTSEDSAEVAHEALIREWPTLRSWLDDNREGLRLHRQLTDAAQEWLLMGREPDLLYRGARLAQAREWAASHAEDLNALEHEFLNASIEQSERELADREAQRQRELAAAKELAETQHQAASSLRIRNRVITIIGSLALILAILVGMFGIQSNQNARQAQANFANAEAQRLAALANGLLQQGGKPELIALLSLRSMTTQYSPQGDAALVGAAGLDYPLQVFTAPDLITAIDYSPDGKYLLTGGEDDVTRLWDVKTGQVVREFIDHTNMVGNVAFSPDGGYIVTESVDGTLRLWDVKTGKEIRQLTGLSEPALAVAISPDGKRIATGGFDKIVRLWDIDTGKEIHGFVGHTNWVHSLDYSPDGKYLLTGSIDNTVRLWDISTGEEIRRFVGQQAAFSPHGKHIATGSTDAIIRVFDVQTGEELRQFIGHTAPINGVTFSSDGKYLASTAGDGTVRLWDVPTGREVGLFSGEAMVSFSPDGNHIVTGSDGGTARLWSIQHHPVLQRFDHTAGVNGVAFSPDGKLAATGGVDGVARLWNAATGEKMRDLMGHTDVINYGIAFSPDGKYLLTGSWDSRVIVWNLGTGQEIHTFTTGDRVNSVAFSPDGKSILAGSNDQMAWLWDAVRGPVMHKFDAGGDGTNGIQRAVFSTDGESIATAGVDGIARLWDATTGKELRQFVAPEGGLNTVMFSSDGKYILTGGLIVQLWNVSTGQELREFDHEVWTAAFSPDGRFVATAGPDGTARLWDTQTGQELRRLIAHDAGVEDIDFSPDGKYLLTGSDDGTAILWDVDVHTTIAKLCSRLLRDFSEEERKQYNIMDTTPTCPKS